MAIYQVCETKVSLRWRCEESFEFQVDEDELLTELEALVGEKETPPAKAAEPKDLPLPEVPADNLLVSPEAAAGDQSETVPQAKKQRSKPSEKQMVEA